MKEREKRGKCRRDSLSGVPDGTWLEDWRDGENEREREKLLKPRARKGLGNIQ